MSKNILFVSLNITFYILLFIHYFYIYSFPFPKLLPDGIR